MPRWPLLVVMLLGCSGEGDELEAPMLGDCATCKSAPSAGNGSSSSSGSGSDASFDGGDASFDVNNAPDVLDIVDTGVPNDL